MSHLNWPALYIEFESKTNIIVLFCNFCRLRVFFEFFSTQYFYLNLCVYCLFKIFHPIRLFGPVRLFGTLTYISRYNFYCLDCPEGYNLQPGDIPGWGQIGKNPSTETDVSGCSKRCNEEASCCSFEYSPTEHKCNLNKDCAPSQNKYKDYAFCTKGNTAHIHLDILIPKN